MKNKFNIAMSFEGKINYEVEADSKEEATEEAYNLFNDESLEVLATQIEHPVIEQIVKID